MNTNLFTSRLSIGYIAATIASGNLLAQAPPSAAPVPVPPPPPVAPRAVEPAPPLPIPLGASRPLTPASADLPPTTNPTGSGSTPGNNLPSGRGSTKYMEMPVLTLTRGMLDEQIQLDPQTAAKKYEEMVSAFDQQREVAAQAVLRLGEAYRKMKRIDEARVMYARILREFVDFPELVKLSMRMLSENAPPPGSGNIASPDGVPNADEQDLIKEELALLESQMKQAELRIKAGLESPTSLYSIQREMLQLKQRLARARTDWPTSTTPELPAPETASRTIRAGGSSLLNEQARLQFEVSDLQTQIILLSDHKQPDTISTQVIADPRFAELKANYERKLLDASSDESSKKALAEARDRLAKWINQIYLPELENTIQVKLNRLKELEERLKTRAR